MKQETWEKTFHLGCAIADSNKLNQRLIKQIPGSNAYERNKTYAIQQAHTPF